jgi:predicted ArsR family transcriptional regulator
MTNAIQLSDLARRAWRQLSQGAQDERQVARVLGCTDVQAREALTELARAGIASRKRRKPMPGRSPTLLWALNNLRVIR